jgi:hypothetical protein
LQSTDKSGAALNLDQLRRTGGDPRAGPSSQASASDPNPRVRVLEMPPSPSPDPLTYWPMEPSDTATSPRGRREPPYAIHGWGPCPYPVVTRRIELSLPSLREGGEGVAVAEEDDEEDPVEIIPVLGSPPRPAPRHMTRIQVGVQGRPTGTLAPRSEVREVDWWSPVSRSDVWPPPPPPPSDTMTPTLPPLQQEEITTPPPLLSPVGGLDPPPVHPSHQL